MILWRLDVTLLLTVGLFGALAAAEVINPYPRPLVRATALKTWAFERDAEGWTPAHHATMSVQGGVLRIVSLGEDPYLVGGKVRLRSPSAVTLRMKCKTGGMGQVFWTTVRSPRWAEAKSKRFRLIHDGEWHEYTVPFDVRGTLSQLRLDPGSGPGHVEVDLIEVSAGSLHPLELERVESGGEQVAVHVRNHSVEAIECVVNGRAVVVAAKGTQRVVLDAKRTTPFAALAVVVTAKGLPTQRRPVFLFRPEARAAWIVRKSKDLTLRLAPDGSGARLERDGALVAVVAPLVHRGGVVPKMVAAEDGETVRFRGEGVAVAVSLRGDEVSVSIESPTACEGPVLRALGGLEQGLLAGLEYLGKGERSSSKLDIETDEHLRFAPDPLKVTMPLMACVSERGAAAMLWENMALQPVFAVPNFFDGAPDHRMALRGKRVRATLLCRRASLEEVILWAVKKRGLPAVPPAPRERKAQWALCLKALDGPLKTKDGWGHCAEPRWGRRWYADHASTIWRLTGKAPEMPEIVPGGAHVANDAIYFVTGKAGKWLEVRGGQARGTIRQQRPDGSFRYKGKYQRGHFEDTASGYCARPAATLLELAHFTGDKAALAAGLKTLEYMKRFRTPRGAQTWEVPLHTPDVLASAYLVWAYVRGYELTGKEEYLVQARAWALSGVPFVYQWGRYPIMTYASPPVYGATNWRAPNWMGLPVQWCGGVYAYALTLLAPHEKTLDWAKLARGILVAAEQMQNPGGRAIGCLPDVFELSAQQRRPAMINPCALVSLRLRLDGEVDSLAVASDGGHRVVAPFPVAIRDGKAHIEAKRGVAYQILIDGVRIVDVQSRGKDVVPLD